jgi:tRNA pseudouridine synthase 10
LPEVVQKYRLCEMCLRRQHGKPEDFEISGSKECFICRGLTESASAAAAAVVREARRYEFKTFAVGLSMPQGVQEREDELRSAMKLKGSETIKLQLSAAIATQASRTLRKRIDKVRPDLTVVVNMLGLKVKSFSKPLYFYGRYTKPRGVSQKREWCQECRGRGCQKCKSTGFDTSSSSVEGLVRKKFSLAGSDNMIFTWIGSEDRESEVLPPGRPFLVEIKNPVRRKLPKRFKVRGLTGLVKVGSGRILSGRPTKLPSFRFRTRIFASTSASLDPGLLRELRVCFRDATVQFDRPHDKSVVKRVTALRAKADGKRLVIDVELDGGLPVKRFVNGELVSPSVSEVLKAEVRCQNFDIRRVMETSGFEFA